MMPSNLPYFSEIPKRSLSDSSQVVSGDLGWKSIWKLLYGNHLSIGETIIINKTTGNSKGYLLLGDIFDIFYLCFNQTLIVLD